jgi:hypothetical protein
MSSGAVVARRPEADVAIWSPLRCARGDFASFALRARNDLGSFELSAGYASIRLA